MKEFINLSRGDLYEISQDRIVLNQFLIHWMTV